MWERRTFMCGGWSSTNDEKIICNKKSFMCRFNISYMNVHNVKVIYGHIFKIMNIFIHTAHTWNNFEKWDEDRIQIGRKFENLMVIWEAHWRFLGYLDGFLGYTLVEDAYIISIDALLWFILWGKWDIFSRCFRPSLVAPWRSSS